MHCIEHTYDPQSLIHLFRPIKPEKDVARLNSIFGKLPGATAGELISGGFSVDGIVGTFLSSRGGGDTGREPARGGGGAFFVGVGETCAGALASALDGRTPECRSWTSSVRGHRTRSSIIYGRFVIPRL